MANTGKAIGLRSSHGPSNVVACYVPATDSTELAIGDPVIVTSDGSNSSKVTTATCAYEAGTLREVTIATAGDGNRWTGAVVGIDPISATDTSQRTRTASTEAVVYVECHPKHVYEAQIEGTATSTMVGLNGVLKSGTISGGLSAWVINNSTDVPSTDASNQVRIIGVSRDPKNNDLSSATPYVYVVNNASTEAEADGGTLGI